MTRERMKELLPVLTAWANGEVIQFRTSSDQEWRDVTDPCWAHCAEYRAKPKALEVWLILTGDTYSDVRGLNKSEDEAREFAEQYKNARVVKMREVES